MFVTYVLLSLPLSLGVNRPFNDCHISLNWFFEFCRISNDSFLRFYLMAIEQPYWLKIFSLKILGILATQYVK